MAILYIIKNNDVEFKFITLLWEKDSNKWTGKVEKKPLVFGIVKIYGSGEDKTMSCTKKVLIKVRVEVFFFAFVIHYFKTG